MCVHEKETGAEPTFALLHLCKSRSSLRPELRSELGPTGDPQVYQELYGIQEKAEGKIPPFGHMSSPW